MIKAHESKVLNEIMAIVNMSLEKPNWLFYRYD